MSFEPHKITQQHVLNAAEAIDAEQLVLKPSTKYDVIVNGKSYPPKDLMRLAHQQATGVYQWDKTGGDETNKYLINLGFQIKEKDQAKAPLTYLINQYKDLIRNKGLGDELYKWELLNEFGGRPDVKAPDFYAELKSINYENLIYGPGIGAMNQIAKYKPQEYSACFKRLFDQTRPLTDRMKDFSAETLVLFRQVDPNEKHNHYHDERTIATLLTFYDPLKYVFYKDSFYQKYCKLIDQKPKEAGQKYVHYLDLIEGFIEEYIKPDEELLDLVSQSLTADAFEDDCHFVLAQDILYSVLDKNARTFKTLVDELNAAITEDPSQVQFSIFLDTCGKDKTAEWIWVGDAQQVICNQTAHYEIRFNLKKSDELIICLHFEADDVANQQVFHQVLGKQLPQSMKWISWFESKSIQFKTTVKFLGEDTVPNLINTLNEFDLAIGDQVRNIIQNMPAKPTSNAIAAEPQSLNTILYGPPGTGKTYHTINKALEILGENPSAISRTAARSMFDQYMEDGHIVFTTFHQSLAYEDFIEGIKPQMASTDNAALSYLIEDGIFKQLCKKAESKTDLRKQNKDIFTNSRYFKMSLGGLQNPEIHDWCIANNYVALGWGEDKDFTELAGISDWVLYRDEFNKRFPELVKSSRFNIQAMYTFQQMKVGNIVVISKGNRIIDAIGRISGDYEWNDHTPTGYYQFRKVEWLATNLNQSPTKFFKKNISQQTIYEFYDSDVKKEDFRAFFQQDAKSDKPYVLIIDEINRGNVSQVFGELITLIEDTKRIGQPEELSVVLPYSKEKFAVPANVFIIGTMNTADRSVESLDTALRRRFSFQEMLPKPELLNPYACLLRFYQKYNNVSWVDWEMRYAEKGLKFYEFYGLNEINVGSKLEKEFSDALGDHFNEQQIRSQLGKLQIQVSPQVDLSKLLSKLNQRIMILKDRDHQIGHAYFIGLEGMEDLMIVFKDKIIPLLQEYFFGDYQKIQLILGTGFIESFDSEVEFAVEDDHDYSEVQVYRVCNDALADVDRFEQALGQLKI